MFLAKFSSGDLHKYYVKSQAIISIEKRFPLQKSTLIKKTFWLLYFLNSKYERFTIKGILHLQYKMYFQEKSLQLLLIFK